MKKLLIALAFLASAAHAQFTPNQVLRAQDLNAALAAPTITGGTINNATIGATTPRNATFTSVTAGTVTASVFVGTSTTSGTASYALSAGTATVALSVPAVSVTGTVLAPAVVTSSLTSVGTLTNLNVTGLSALTANSASTALSVTQAGAGKTIAASGVGNAVINTTYLQDLMVTGGAANFGTIRMTDNTTYSSFINWNNAELNLIGPGSATKNLVLDNAGGVAVGAGLTAAGAITATGANINLSNAFNLTGRNNANTLNLALIGRTSGDLVSIDPDGYGAVSGGSFTTGAGINIGSGTPVAGAKMILGKTQAASESFLPALSQLSAAGAGNDLALGSTSTSGKVRVFTGAATTSGALGTGSNAERMTIDETGKVTVTEQVILKDGSSASPSFGFSTTSNSGLYRSGGGIGISASGVASGYIDSNTGGGGLYFEALGTNQNIRLVPSGTGIVDLRGGAAVTGVSSVTGAAGGFLVNRRDTSANAFQMYSAAGNLQFYDYTGGADRLTLNSTGASVAGTFDATGVIRATRFGTVGYNPATYSTQILLAGSSATENFSTWIDTQGAGRTFHMGPGVGTGVVGDFGLYDNTTASLRWKSTTTEFSLPGNISQTGGGVLNYFGPASGGNNLTYARSSGGTLGLWAGGDLGILANGAFKVFTNQTAGSESFAGEIATFTAAGLDAGILGVTTAGSYATPSFQIGGSTYGAYLDSGRLNFKSASAGGFVFRDVAGTGSLLDIGTGGTAVTGTLSTTGIITATGGTGGFGEINLTGPSSTNRLQIQANSGSVYDIKMVDQGTMRFYVNNDVAQGVSIVNGQLNALAGLAVTGDITITGALTVGGGTVTATLSGTSPSIGGGVLAAGACASDTVAITGASTAMAVSASPVTYPGDGNYWAAYVSGADTVTVKVCAAIAGTPTASIYRVRVHQ